jgi:hypothetical protein
VPVRFVHRLVVRRRRSMSRHEQTHRREGNARLYAKPTLEFYGTLRELTGTVGDKATPDGGTTSMDMTNPG